MAEAGGSCIICGFDSSPAALEFHHLDPSEKAFAVSNAGMTRSLESARVEARKCDLLCANCHAQVEIGTLVVPTMSGSPNHPPRAELRGWDSNPHVLSDT